MRKFRAESSEKQAAKAAQTERAIERLDVVEEPRREAELRMIAGPSANLEVKCVDAAANPYLLLAGLLAAGLDGVACRTEPPACFDGDVYAARDLPHVPRTLAEATDLFAASPFAKAAFGQPVVDHYTHFFRTEWAAYMAAVSDWERRRYFERI